jgi:thiosulfate dehydrogenase [quinone] large subunit
MMFLFAGINKMPGVGGFADHLVKLFEKTWLPSSLVSLFGYVLPFAELILGVLLVLGLFRGVALFGTGVLLILLTFGQVLLGQPQVVFSNTAYVFMTAGLLFLADYDAWVIFPPQSTEAPDREP